MLALRGSKPLQRLELDYVCERLFVAVRVVIVIVVIVVVTLQRALWRHVCAQRYSNKITRPRAKVRHSRFLWAGSSSISGRR